MTLEDEDSRGIEARRVLESPIYVEAYATIEEKLINQMALAETTAERGEHLRRLLVAHRKIRQYIQQVMITGQMAEQELERKRSVSDKMMGRK
jgi:hypothetical protein